MSAEQDFDDTSRTTDVGAVRLESPRIGDGHSMWRIARDSESLDVNSPYSYVLWCRDFSRTSAVARSDDGIRGFVNGYVRPDDPSTLFVWQIAVDRRCRARRLGRRLLDHLGDRMEGLGCRYLEATVTPGNAASARLFTSFAESREARLSREVLFDGPTLPSGHEPEVLFRIGPLPAGERAPVRPSLVDAT